jgi:hypothetical protein
MKAYVEKIDRDRSAACSRTTFRLADGTRVQVEGEYTDGEYDVEVKVTRVRTPLPKGYHWEGNEIVSSCGALWRVAKGGTEPGVYGSCKVVYMWIIEAFQKEGLL